MNWMRARPLHVAAGCATVFAIIVMVVVSRRQDDAPRDSTTRPSVSPLVFQKPERPLDGDDPDPGEPIDFETSLVTTIHDRGYLSVTVHVALYKERRRQPRSFADGRNTAANMYWGARYGINTYFVKSGGWTRVYTDQGESAGPLERSIFHKRVQPSAAWQARSVEAPFDIYVLAVAWPHSEIASAMQTPLDEALCSRRVTITVDDRPLEFGGGSEIIGYLGQNDLLTHYRDLFAPAGTCPPPRRQPGIFYLAPRSAVLLSGPAVDHGLYSVLFARETITPEAYLLDGMLNALIAGELDDGFIHSASAAYATYQKSIRESQARVILMR